MLLNRRHFSFTEVLTPNYPIGCCELHSDFARGKNCLNKSKTYE